MNKFLKIAIILILIAGVIYFGCRLANAHEPSPESESLGLGDIENVKIPSELPSIVKEYEGFTVNFNPENRTPNCVSWILQGNETGGASSRSNKFWTDTEIDGCADTRDYSRSGYDRGHMCPAGEQKWSDEAMHHSFVMTNICPQKHELNSGAWKTLEDKERVWAKRDSLIVIVAGPIYESSDTERIGYGKVRVPSAFFKVLLAPYSQPMRAIGFVYPNMYCPGNLSEYATTVDEVEQLTGFDFFSSLPDDIEEEIESASSFKEWNSNKKKSKP